TASREIVSHFGSMPDQEPNYWKINPVRQDLVGTCHSSTGSKDSSKLQAQS
ncbi:Hypothetical protein FKW44_010052, partial [Caligus rogercresseyi]